MTAVVKGHDAVFLLFLGQRMRPAGCLKAYEFFYELAACQSVLLQEQFDHALALLLNLLVFLTHIAVVL